MRLRLIEHSVFPFLVGNGSQTLLMSCGVAGQGHLSRTPQLLWVSCLGLNPCLLVIEFGYLEIVELAVHASAAAAPCS